MASRLEIGTDLERKLHITVPATIVDQTFKEVTRYFQKQSHFKGFRPGHAPLAMVKKTYFGDILESVTRHLLKTSFAQETAEHKLQVAGEPNFHFDWPKENQDFQFSVTLEVLPEVHLNQVEQLPAKKNQYKITEAHVDQSLNKIRYNLAEWQPVDRPAKWGDLVIINFEGFLVSDEKADDNVNRIKEVNQKPFTSVEKFSVHLGSGQLIKGFEEGLVGTQAGEQCTLNLSFPEDYHQSEFAGKSARFEVLVTQVQEKKPLELDEHLFKKLGHSSLEATRNFIREQLQKEWDAKAQKGLVESVLESLVARNPVKIPLRLLKEQKRRLVKKIQEDLINRQVSENEQEEYLKKHDAELESLARKQLHQDFLIFEIARQKNLETTHQDIEQYFQDTAKKIGIDVERVKSYYAQENRYHQLSAQLQYQKVIDYLIAHAQIEVTEAEVPLDLPLDQKEDPSNHVTRS
ncbi:MAG: trigger factor [Bdellovibrionaceae bacterium]|nr:trigger factor [Pseudobdellovibrionaceae bacterium]MDW8189557.1 trigger factor [Pseudobdellovibrionaceae bacterium]